MTLLDFMIGRCKFLRKEDEIRVFDFMNSRKEDEIRVFDFMIFGVRVSFMLVGISCARI